MPDALIDHLRRRIALDGPLSVAAYMEEALGHPRFGYYMTRDPLGAEGDFVTAPEISQMFGELIGLWCAVVWQSMGRPAAVNLVELGPGRGTLMADALRAAGMVSGFREALAVHLVETSPALRRCQGRALEDTDARWHDSFARVPEGPLLLIANEFFDALPIRQFERRDGAWRERLIDAGGEAGGLCWVLSPPVPPIFGAPGFDDPGDIPEGAVVEVRPVALALAHALGERLAGAGGAALIVDYGYQRSAPGDTLQAVRGHAFHDPLEDPGEADLTAHVDFAALARAAAEGGARTYGPVPQGGFLESLGIAARTEALVAAATPGQTADIAAAQRRLVGAADMGELFKVLALTHPELPPPPGFD